MNEFLNDQGNDGETNAQNGWVERYGLSNPSAKVTWLFGGAANPGWAGSMNLTYHLDGMNRSVSVDAAKLAQATFWHEWSHIYLHTDEDAANKYGLQKIGAYW